MGQGARRRIGATFPQAWHCGDYEGRSAVAGDEGPGVVKIECREIYFAASNNSAHAVLKVKPSDIFVTDREEGFSHVFTDILGQEFKARPEVGAGQIDALSFAMSGLLAAAKDKAF